MKGSSYVKGQPITKPMAKKKVYSAPKSAVTQEKRVSSSAMKGKYGGKKNKM